MERIKNFFKDESGASAVEYGLLVALIAVVIIACGDVTGYQPLQQVQYGCDYYWSIRPEGAGWSFTRPFINNRKV